jgi:hypothetical protein
VAHQFAVSFDYRCPFARNAHESVIAGLRAGRDWDVAFTPFSLDQVHVEEGEPPVWERDPAVWGSGVNALLWGITVRDLFPDKFLDWHGAAFAALREGRKIAKRGPARLRRPWASTPTRLRPRRGQPALETSAQAHTRREAAPMFGVLTIVVDDRAALVRFMDRESRHRPCARPAQWRLNEFGTPVPR